MSITVILNLFLAQMACGMLALCLFLPKDTVDRHFYKSIGLFSMIFIVASLIMRWHYPLTLPDTFASDSAATSYLFANILYGLVAASALMTWGITRFTVEKPFRFFLNAASILALPAVLIDSLIYLPQGEAVAMSALLVPIHFVTASLVLGGFLLGMIFGHWYLINVDMPKKLLVKMAWLLVGTLALKIIAVGLTFALQPESLAVGDGLMHMLISLKGYGLFFWQRILIGLAIPAVIAYMIWSTARIGSSQSATGIMYVGVAFIFIGELIAKFLFLFSTIPL